jgi:hypothetical protein
MIQRLIDFYHRSNQDPSSLSHIWSGILRDFHGKLIDALTRRDAAEVQSVFDNPDQVIHGLNMTIMQQWGPAITTDLFPMLARRIGVLSVFHPLNPSPNENWNCRDGVELRRRIEEVVGPMHVPEGFVCKDTSNGVPVMYFLKLGQWFTIKSLMDPPPQRVLEIGAGTGDLGLVAFQNGVRDYTVIDIPSVAVLSAYYLSKAFGEDKVWLAGEPPNPNAIGRWYSCHDYSEAQSDYGYDLIVNCNSFPEMTIENQDGYIKFIRESLDTAGLFYSSNHESDLQNQSSVLTAVKRNGGLKMIYRAPSMMREGYVEEFYRRS